MKLLALLDPTIEHIVAATLAAKNGDLYACIHITEKVDGKQESASLAAKALNFPFYTVELKSTRHEQLTLPLKLQIAAFYADTLRCEAVVFGSCKENVLQETPPPLLDALNLLSFFTTNTRVRISPVLITLSREEIWQLGKQNNAPLEHVNLCKAGTNCGTCSGCKELALLRQKLC